VIEVDNGGDVMSFLQKRSGGGDSGGTGPGRVAGSLAALPGVLEYLSSSKYPDGSARERSTLLVLIEHGVVKVCLSDRDQSQSLWRSGESLEDCLLSLEEALTGTHADWRTSSGGGGKGSTAKRRS
jgi:hypothetical protein